MAPGSWIDRIALIVFCILLLPYAVCATPIQTFHGPYPEQLPSDSTPLYIWNVPLSILILEFVCVSAPALFIPMQLLFSLSVWLRLGQKRVTYRNVLENENRNAVYMCIQENPGIHMHALSRVLGMNIGTARYHMEVLCGVGKVFQSRTPGSELFCQCKILSPTWRGRSPDISMITRRAGYYALSCSTRDAREGYRVQAHHVGPECHLPYEVVDRGWHHPKREGRAKYAILSLPGRG